MGGRGQGRTWRRRFCRSPVYHSSALLQLLRFASGNAYMTGKTLQMIRIAEGAHKLSRQLSLTFSTNALLIAGPPFLPRPLPLSALDITTRIPLPILRLLSRLLLILGRSRVHAPIPLSGLLRRTRRRLSAVEGRGVLGQAALVPEVEPAAIRTWPPIRLAVRGRTHGRRMLASLAAAVV